MDISLKAESDLVEMIDVENNPRLRNRRKRRRIMRSQKNNKQLVEIKDRTKFDVKKIPSEEAVELDVEDFECDDLFEPTMDDNWRGVNPGKEEKARKRTMYEKLGKDYVQFSNKPSTRILDNNVYKDQLELQGRRDNAPPPVVRYKPPKIIPNKQFPPGKIDFTYDPGAKQELGYVSTAQKAIECGICQTTISPPTEYGKHMKKMHKEMLQFQTQNTWLFCPQVFPKVKQLQSHLSSAHNYYTDEASLIKPQSTSIQKVAQKQFIQCDSWAAVFDGQVALRKHVRWVHINDPHTCVLWREELRNMRQAHFHIKTKHAEVYAVYGEEFATLLESEASFQLDTITQQKKAKAAEIALPSKFNLVMTPTGMKFSAN